MKKRVMLYAYTRGNLGDDLFIKILCERYPHVLFFLNTSTRHTSAIKKIPNLKIVSRENLFVRMINYPFKKLSLSDNFFKKVMAYSCDISIQIGGSLFIQHQGWKDTIKYNKNIKLKKQSYYLIGMNFGPYFNEEFLEEHKYIFLNYDDVTTRESYTFNLFKDSNKVRFAPDLVFNIKSNCFNKKNTDGYVLFSVINLKERNDLNRFIEEYESKIIEQCLFLLNQGTDVKFISFCEFEGDNLAINRIIESLLWKSKNFRGKLSKYEYKDNINEALDIISGAKLIIASRLHAMVLGFTLDIPTVPLCYSDKMLNVLNDINFKGHIYDIRKNINSLDLNLQKNDYYLNKIENLGELKSKSVEHFKYLDYCLGEG